MYTLGWWNNATRKLPEAWRCLGLINDLDKKSKESKKANTVDKACTYQSAVGAIVESLVYVQKEDGILYDLKYKNNIYRCRLTFVVQFLSGDIKASDAMCGRYSGHSLGMARSNHDCDCKPTKIMIIQRIAHLLHELKLNIYLRMSISNICCNHNTHKML